MDCSPAGSSIQGIFQARILEWVTISFSRRSSQPRYQTCISCIGKRILYCWATREALWQLSSCLFPERWRSHLVLECGAESLPSQCTCLEHHLRTKLVEVMEFQLSYSKSWEMMLWKCCTQYVRKFGKLSSGHRTGKGQFSFQSQRKAMPKNAQTTAQLHSSHTLVK